MTTVIFYMGAMNFPRGNFIKKEGQPDPDRSKMDGRDPSRVIHMRQMIYDGQIGRTWLAGPFTPWS